MTVDRCSQMIHHFLSKQFLGFLIVGAFAALVNFATRILLNRWMSFSSAIILAYLTGMIIAYLVSKAFVFTTSHQSTVCFRQGCVTG